MATACVEGLVPQYGLCGDTGCETYATYAIICTPQQAAQGCFNDKYAEEYVDQCCGVQYGNWGTFPDGNNPCVKLAMGTGTNTPGKVQLADNSADRGPSGREPRSAPRRPSHYVYLLDCKGAYEPALVPSSP